ncbi:response regulator [Nitrospira sp. M1]
MSRILIVDDEPDHRLVLRTMLEGAGYECEEAGDGMAALAVLERSDIDVVLTDLQMPRMDGFRFAEHVAAHATFQSIPIIVVSSQTPDLIPSSGGENKIFTMLSKPYEWPKVLTAVANALAVVERSQYEASLVGS